MSNTLLMVGLSTLIKLSAIDLTTVKARIPIVLLYFFIYSFAIFFQSKISSLYLS